MKTQEQLYRDAQTRAADGNNTFLELLNDKENPLTADDLRANICRRPELWGRFACYIPYLESRERITQP